MACSRSPSSFCCPMRLLACSRQPSFCMGRCLQHLILSQLARSRGEEPGTKSPPRSHSFPGAPQQRGSTDSSSSPASKGSGTIALRAHPCSEQEAVCDTAETCLMLVRVNLLSHSTENVLSIETFRIVPLFFWVRTRIEYHVLQGPQQLEREKSGLDHSIDATCSRT